MWISLLYYRFSHLSHYFVTYRPSVRSFEIVFVFSNNLSSMKSALFPLLFCVPLGGLILWVYYFLSLSICPVSLRASCFSPSLLMRSVLCRSFLNIVFVLPLTYSGLKCTTCLFVHLYKCPRVFLYNWLLDRLVFKSHDYLFDQFSRTLFDLSLRHWCTCNCL